MGLQTLTFQILITKYRDDYPQCFIYKHAPENVADT